MARPKRQAKRAGNVNASTSGARKQPARRSATKAAKKGGNKKRKNVPDARSIIGRQRAQNTPRTSAGRRRGAISDARQIINAQQQTRRPPRQAAASRSRGFPPSAANVILQQHLAGPSSAERSAFSQAVKAAVVPMLAPLIRSALTAAAPAPAPVPLPTRASNGPCILRIVNLAPSVAPNDLTDLLKNHPGFERVEMESPGIAVANFRTRSTAQAVVDEYNNRELDGQMMVIQVEPLTSSGSGTAAVSRLGPRR